MPYAEANGIELIELRKPGYTLLQDLYRDTRTVNIPARMANGAPGNRNCTGNFKIAVVARWLKQHGASKEKPATVGLGISIDEIGRVRTDSGIPHEVLEYPLIDLRLNRRDCVRLIELAGLPVPPKSSCYFCPFKKHGDWLELRRTRRDLFDKAVALEHRINEKRAAMGRDALRLHSSLVPLEDAVGLQYSMFEDDACESGYCMT
jgi:hypothetical protein